MVFGLKREIGRTMENKTIKIVKSVHKIEISGINSVNRIGLGYDHPTAKMFYATIKTFHPYHFQKLRVRKWDSKNLIRISLESYLQVHPKTTETNF